MKIKAILLAMAANEIKQMIPPYLLEDIKRRDPKPLFKAFVIGQEGKAEATLVSVGNVIKTWFADAIGKLSRKIWPGMKLFHNHGETNDHEGRDQIGEVAGVRAKSVDGKFSTVIAAYVFPEFSNLPLDIASIEAVINIDDNRDGVHAVDVEDVTGIALGNSALNRPGFPGATLIGTLQAFAKDIQLNKGGKVTKEEMKQGIKDGSFTPSDLFSSDELTSDTFVSAHIKECEKKASVSEYGRRKDAEDKLTTIKSENETANKALKDENATLKSENAGSKSGDIFKSKYVERKLTTKQIEFIEAKRKNFKVSDPEKINEEIDTFMDTRVVELKENMELLGVKDESKVPEIKDEENKEPENKTPGSEAAGDELKGEDADLAPPL